MTTSSCGRLANPDYYWGNFVLARADPGNHERWLAVFAGEFPDATHVAIGLDGVLPADGPLAGYRAAACRLKSRTSW